MASDRRSWLERIFGRRTLFNCVFGTMFSNAKNTSGIIAMILLLVVAYLWLTQAPVPDQLAAAAMAVVSFYFGTTRSAA
jgi:hypothetical protein